MTYTERELRAALAEDRLDGPIDIDGIVRRGRRIRRRRRIAAAVLAVAPVVTLAAVLWPGSWAADLGNRRDGTDRVATEPGPPPELPREITTSRDVVAPLIAWDSRTEMGTGATVRFRPRSVYTAYRIVCADRAAFVVIRTPSRTILSRCGGSGASTEESAESAPADWLTRPHSVSVWVLPANVPVTLPVPRRSGSTEYVTCRLTGSESSECSDALAGLLRPGALEAAAAHISRYPGRWSVGVYDVREAGPATQPTAAVQVTPGPGG